MLHTWNIEKVRTMIGVCPQYNLQFDSFTVMENLLFFAEIKLIDRVRAKLEVRFVYLICTAVKTKKKVMCSYSLS